MNKREQITKILNEMLNLYILEHQVNTYNFTDKILALDQPQEELPYDPNLGTTIIPQEGTFWDNMNDSTKIEYLKDVSDVLINKLNKLNK